MKKKPVAGAQQGHMFELKLIDLENDLGLGSDIKTFNQGSAHFPLLVKTITQDLLIKCGIIPQPT